MPPHNTPDGFYVDIAERLSHPMVVERPTGLITIVHIRRGLLAPVVVEHAAAALTEPEQATWLGAFGFPPRIEEIWRYIHASDVATLDYVPVALHLPPMN